MHSRMAFGAWLLACVLAFASCTDDDAGQTATPIATADSVTATSVIPTRAPTVFEIPTNAVTPSSTLVATCPAVSSDAFPLGKTTEAFMTSGGAGRTYLIYVPASYTGAEPVPLVLNFHGLGSNGAQQHLYSGLVPIAEREGFVLVSPDGVNNSWLIAPGVNDIQFTRDLVATVSEQLCIDPGAVFSTGMSNGGFMSAALACVAGDLVAAVAPVAGVLGPSANCGEPVPFLQFHGTDDAVVPYEGGTISATGGPFGGIEAIMDGWAEHNGCSGEPITTEAAASVDLVEYQGCDAETAHYVVEGGGHTWPGGPAVVRLGATTDEISASELMWEFFEEHRR